MTIYKVLNGNKSTTGGYTWSLPVKNDDGTWTPGEWTTPVEGKLELCENGYHLCDGERQLVEWLGPDIYEAEYRGDRVDGDDKIVVRQAHLIRKVDAWNERTARLFACDCAEAVLHLHEEKYPGDDRPRMAIETARRYARGEATTKELAAARDAAWDAAWAATWAAARDATWAATWDAARAAARDAARAAAWDAAWANQTKILVGYLEE